MSIIGAPVYLDYAATSPLADEARAAMLTWLTGESEYGNPSSIHSFGRKARTAVDDARDSVASLIHADYSEITFTSSGTEADNLAIIGVMSESKSRTHLVTTSVEHHAVLHSAHFLSDNGFDVTVVPVQPNGVVCLDRLESAITDKTALVSVMHANNEIGTIQPVAKIAEIAHRHGALFHTDAIQSVGMLPVDVISIGCDLLSMSAHKIYGPKGAAALFARSGIKIRPIIHGGAQERERRAGTENVAGIVGFGAAARLSIERRDMDSVHLTALRDRFILDLQSTIAGLTLNGDASLRLPNNINVSIVGIEGSTLLMNLDRVGIYASSGAACSSGSIEPSHVLQALGLSSTAASGGIRFSLGRDTTQTQLSEVVSALSRIVDKLRSNGT